MTLHSVGQRLNLRHLCEQLGGTKGLIKAVGFKKATESMWWRLHHILSVDHEEQVRMLTGSEFQTEGTATLILREANGCFWTFLWWFYWLLVLFVYSFLFLNF